MVRLRIPSVIITIPRIAACVALAGIVASSLHFDPQSSGAGQLHSQQAATHQAVLSTPAPAVTLPTAPAATTPVPPATTDTLPTPITTANIPHSAQPAPVITPAAGASVSSLTPVSSNTTPSTRGTGPGVPSNTTTPPAVSMTDGYTSANWAGYIANTSTNIGGYTAISGSWVVPTATTSGATVTADATWIGIGGVKETNDLIQVGTEDTVTSKGDTPMAFFELLPGSARTITALKVAPGDTISASLAETAPGAWKISIADTTTGQAYTTMRSYFSSQSTAEWIEEEPSSSLNGPLIPLDTFTPVSFTNGSVTTVTADNTTSTLTIATSNAQPVTLVQKRDGTYYPIITPSILGSDGQSFTVTADSADQSSS